MLAGPARLNELFARLSETSEGAVKTRERLFAELKAELEQHTSLEEQHLFPVLRRSPETRELVAGAARDNKELRARLAELEALPKTDEAFPERLRELQKAFRQHARDEKTELLPAVQRALSELEFSRKRIAIDVRKALYSAISNAENNHNLDIDSLVVAEAFVGKNLVMKRFSARARGRASRIEKPFSEITIVVREQGEAA